MPMTKKQRERRKRRMRGERVPPAVPKRERQAQAAEARAQDARREADWRRHNREMNRYGVFGGGI